MEQLKVEVQDDLIFFLDQILKLAVDNLASDVFMKANTQPHIKIEGVFVPVDVDPMTPVQIEELASRMMPARISHEFFNVKPEANLVYAKKEIGRFRVNIYRERSNVGIVMRRVQEDIPTVEGLGLPDVLKKLVMNKRGLILVTGPTGSGKIHHPGCHAAPPQ
jgi:twitching motility protein PilU